MALKKYSQKELIAKVKSHLRSRYHVPEDIIAKIDFEKYLKSGMTLPQAREVLMRAYPELIPYIAKERPMQKIEEKEEDLDKRILLFGEIVKDAEKGDERAKRLVGDLVLKAIKENDEKAKKIIESVFKLPFDEAINYMLEFNILPDDVVKELRETEKPKITGKEKELSKYKFLITDVGREIADLDKEMSKISIEHVAKYGLKVVSATLERYKSDFQAKKAALEAFKTIFPEKTNEIDRTIKLMDYVVQKYEDLFERFAPVDVEAIVGALARRLEKTVRTALVEELAKVGLTPEVQIEEVKDVAIASCVCYECGKPGIVRILGSHAYCEYHALLLEEQWKKKGIPPQWNPDMQAVCAECGKVTEYFRCSAGITYCFDCAKKLEGQILFDDEMAQPLGAALSVVRKYLGRLK